MEGWSGTMYSLMGSENTTFVPIYYVFLILVVSFMMVNLFVAVITNTFSKTRKEANSIRRFSLPLLITLPNNNNNNNN